MYQQSQFVHMQYNPLSKGLLLELYPQLDSIFPDIPESGELIYDEVKEQVLRYIISLYDPRSPLQVETNLYKRQLAAGAIAGIEEKDVLWTKLVEQSDDWLVQAQINYMSEYANNMVFVQLVANEAVFWRLVKGMMRGDDDAKDLEKSKLGAELTEIENRIELLRKKFFKDDERLMSVSQIIKRKRSSPESWAHN